MFRGACDTCSLEWEVVGARKRGRKCSEGVRSRQKILVGPAIGVQVSFSRDWFDGVPMERGLRPDLRFGKVKRKEISNCTLCKLLSEEVAPTVILTPV